MSETEQTSADSGAAKTGENNPQVGLGTIVLWAAGTLVAGILSAIAAGLTDDLRRGFASEFVPQFFLAFSTASLLTWISASYIYVVELDYLVVDDSDTEHSEDQKKLRRLTLARPWIGIGWLSVIAMFSGEPRLGWFNVSYSLAVGLTALLLTVETARVVAGAGRKTGNWWVRRSGLLSIPDHLVTAICGEEGKASDVARAVCSPAKGLRPSLFALIGLFSFVTLVFGVPASQAEHRKLYPVQVDPEIAIQKRIKVILSGVSMRSNVPKDATFDQTCVYRGGEAAPDELAFRLELKVKTVGSEQGGCPLISIEVSKSPAVWATPGTCGKSLRSLVVASSDGSVGVVFQQVARFALHEAVAGTLLSAGPRWHIAAGDLVPVTTTNGVSIAARRISAKSPKPKSGSLPCSDYENQNVPYSIVPAAALPLWNDINSDGFAWPTGGTDERKRVRRFTFRRESDNKRVGTVTCVKDVCSLKRGSTTRTLKGDQGLDADSILASARNSGLKPIAGL